MAKIYIKFNTAVIKEVEITKDATTFGRKPENDICIENPAISGFHGKIIKDGDQFVVEDLNSTNGTYVNGHRVKKHVLKNKDQIGVARHVLEFVGDTPVEASPPASAPAPAAASARASDSSASPTSAPSSPAPAQAPAKKNMDHGVIKIVSGGVNGQLEVPLTAMVTYMGTSDQSAIKIKGFMAPSLAAAISRRPEGYFLKAVKEGYPKVNGNAVKEQVFLENGSMIEAGSTNMVFYFSGSKTKNDNGNKS